MKWFKHMSNMRHDVRIRRLIKKYRAEGYGIYCAIIESIVETLETDKPLPDLEENAQDMAEYFEIDTLKVNEIMIFCLNQGLFEKDEISGRLLCHKVYKFIEQNQTRSEEMRKMINKYKDYHTIPNYTQMSETVIDKCEEKKRIEENRKEEKRKEQNRIENLNKYLSKIDLINYWNNKIFGSIPKLLNINTKYYDKYKLRVDEGIDFDKIFEMVKKSKFLQFGNGNSPFVFNFRWVVENSNNWMKVMEGNYNDRENTNTGFKTAAEKKDEMFRKIIQKGEDNDRKRVTEFFSNNDGIEKDDSIGNNDRLLDFRND